MPKGRGFPRATLMMVSPEIETDTYDILTPLRVVPLHLHSLTDETGLASGLPDEPTTSPVQSEREG